MIIHMFLRHPPKVGTGGLLSVLLYAPAREIERIALLVL